MDNNSPSGVNFPGVEKQVRNRGLPHGRLSKASLIDVMDSSDVY